MRTLEDWTVERALKMAPGVADVVSRGGFIKQYHVSVDLAKMKSYSVTLQQVLTALDEKTLMATPPDQTSIMCYQLPGVITKDGKPITGGTDINATEVIR